MKTAFTVTGPLMSGNILPDTLAGTWYDADPESLRRQMAAWMKQISPEAAELQNPPIALILPHAGYRYSGQTAAFGIKAVMGSSYTRVIILAPSHRAYLGNRICVSASAAGMRTPLGTAAIDRDAAARLGSLPFAMADDTVIMEEHAIQIQLPLLQYALGDTCRVIPVAVGQLDDEHAAKTAEALAGFADESTLIIASSDFTHFGQNFNYVPFHTDIEANLKQLDLGAFEQIRQKDPAGFAAYIRKTGATICGECPIRILLHMLPSDSSIKLLHYTNSAAQTRDFSHCVSYLSAAAYRNRTENAETADFLSEDEKKMLLSMARHSIAYVFEHHRAAPPDLFAANATENMKRAAGCFVTLHISNDLRGCIGEIEPVRALYQAVTARAVDSAFRDPRFPHLSPQEFKHVTIEISVLTPPTPVASFRDIRIGKHGMTISMNGRTAVFLPQVAPEQGWDLHTTLTYLSRKAGLPSDAWKSPNAKFTVFEAIVFHE